jgi:hypothetical protein
MALNRFVNGREFPRNQVGHALWLATKLSLRWIVLMVLHVLHERSESGGPILAGSETVTYTAESITMIFGDADPVGTGCLFVTTEYVAVVL